MTEVLRFVGYWLGMVVTDIVIGVWKESKMRREFKRYENDNDGAVTAHVVTEDTAGPVMVVGGTSRDVQPGDVLIATDREDVYHVAGSDVLDDYSEADGDDSADLGTLVAEDADAPDADQDNDGYDPSQYSAQEVRAYLQTQRDAGNDAEVDRVMGAERAGLNRVTVARFDQ